MTRSPQRFAELARGVWVNVALRALRAAAASKLSRASALRMTPLGAVILLAPQVALAAAPTAVTIRITTDGEASLVERIRGQLSDLDVSLKTTNPTSPEPSLAERVSAASELGRATSSDVVVWFERSEAALHVYLLSVHSGDVRVRTVHTGAAASVATSDLRTATLETVALVVRDAVAAWRKTEIVGPPPPTVGPSRASDKSAARTKPAQKALVALDAPRPPWQIRSSLGWLAVLSGSGHMTFQGLLFREEVRRGRLGAGLSASTSLPIDVDDGLIRLRLRRMAATLHGAYRLPLGEHFGLDGLAGGGVAVFSRSTEVLQAGASAAPSNDAVTPVLAGELSLTARPWVAGPARGLGFFVSIGVDYAFGPPRYDYATESGVQSGPAIFPVQPRLSLGVAWEIGLRSDSGRAP